MTNDTKSLFVWMTEDRTGRVQQVGGLIPDTGENFTLSHTDRDAAVRLMRPLALAHHRATGQRVWLREFRMVADSEDLA